ncbi:MAG: DNA-binding protein WhiA [Clostridia bacterium]|nr:DNA-binding protein WhiA [Clostridia bacterium]
MSFSSDVKKELCRIEEENGCCAKAELAGIFAFCSTERSGEFILRTENELVAKRVVKLLEQIFAISCETEASSRGTKGVLYTIKLTEDMGLKTVLSALGLYQNNMIKFSIDPFLTQQPCCAQSYLRGAFLGGGSVNSPKRSYHFEIETHYFGLSRDLSALFSDLDFEVKTVMRKGSYVSYIKDSEKIGDILAIMGATGSMMDLYNAKIEKEVNNSVNRRVNCDTANLTKTVNAAVAQANSIRQLVAKKGAEAIPEHLRELADLRLSYPEASLAELSEMLSTPISKSGVNHRLKKLMELAGQL